MPLTVLLHSRNLERTRQFYQSALAFDVRDTAEGTLTVEKWGSALIFTSSNPWESPVGLSGTLYFTIPDLDSYFASVKDKVSLLWPIEVRPYGFRDFGVRDCNDYCLAFKQ